MVFADKKAGVVEAAEGEAAEELLTKLIVERNATMMEAGRSLQANAADRNDGDV
jgi:hypothetical protein